MSSYVMTDLQGRIGLVTDTEPLVYTSGIDASEISALTIAVICTSVSAGVNVGNPATVGIEHSFDDGASWVALTNLNGAVVTGAGTFLTSVTLNTGLVAPIIRVTITAPAGQSIVVSKVRKNRFLPGTIISFAGTSFLGGGFVNSLAAFKLGAGGVYADSFAVYDTTTPANNLGAPSVQLAGQGLGPVDVGAGATTGLTQRVTLATDLDIATETSLAAVGVLLATIEGEVDGLETLVGATNTKLDTIIGYVDGLEGLVDGLEGEAVSTNTKLDTIIGHVDGIEGSIDGLEALATATNTRLAEMAAGLITLKHDSIVPTFNVTSDVWEYKLLGVTQQTLTINYVDATKQVITSVVRT